MSSDFSQASSIHVYDYAPGAGVAKQIINHVNPANPDGLAKDVQFLQCAPAVPTSITLQGDLAVKSGAPANTWRCSCRPG